MTKKILGAFAIVCLSSPAWAADSPDTKQVLDKLHESNQKEIEMGKMAEKNGTSKEVKGFGKTLVSDHTAADKKVKALAKQEKLELATPSPPSGDMPAGADFDAKFSKDMLDDHKKDVAEVSSARDSTTDDKLKKLLTTLVPTLQKHQDIAQKLVDNQKK